MKHNKKLGNYYLTSNNDQSLLLSSQSSSSMNSNIIKIFPENFEIYVSIYKNNNNNKLCFYNCYFGVI